MISVKHALFRGAALMLAGTAFTIHAHAGDWLYWRGPAENGVSPEKNLPSTFQPDGDNVQWTADAVGGGTPIIHGDRLYAFTYVGEREDLLEALVCMNAVTGKKLWEHRFADFISDIVYNRYAVGSPAVDPETGIVYITTSPGLLLAFDPNGNLLWERSMMEEFSRLTFPNGRTGGPTVDGDLVITHAITANWGTNGPARNRFYAFDKRSGALVWFCTPGVGPKDSSFSGLAFQDLEDGNRVFYAGTGCGNVVCVNVRTGLPVWRFQMSTGGVNSSPVVYGKGKLIAIHGKENLDDTSMGRMVCLDIPTSIPEAKEYPIVLDKSAEIWRADLEAFTSSPMVVGNRIYQTVKTGELVCVNGDTGDILWHEKLDPDQLHASPTYGDGKLYVPMFSGEFFIIEPSDEKATILSHAHLPDSCLGAPAIAHGRVYVLSKGKLYCFGSDAPPATTPAAVAKAPKVGPATQLQIIPAEFALKSGDEQTFTVRSLDAAGRVVNPDVTCTWEKFIPPTARVKAEVDATLDPKTGTLTAAADAKLSAGALKATAGNLSATTRGRILQALPYQEDFENTPLVTKDADGVAFSYPPLPWLGARMRWQVIEKDGGKCIGNTLDRVLFQRSMNFLGSPDMADYTMTLDVMTDGNRRVKSTIGMINQRYNISLIGNANLLEVQSNHDRVKINVPFKISANTWYRLTSRVDVNADGSGVVRAKAWPRDEAEPADWTIEAEVPFVHTHGAPGIFGFSPQSLKRVFIDNIVITPNS